MRHHAVFDHRSAYLCFAPQWHLEARLKVRPTAWAAGVLVSCAVCAAPALGLPVGARVAAGQVQIGAIQPNTLTLQQASTRAIINWQQFDIGAGQQVRIVQPGTGAALLNRVTGNTPSTLSGRLQADGQVFLVNPNGISVDPSGRVQAASLVLSTLDIDDADFMANRLAFRGQGLSAAVTQAGQIQAAPGGFVALLGGRVNSSGQIQVPLGRVGLGAGEHLTLDLGGDGFLQVAVPSRSAAATALIEHSGRISADGGLIQIQAAAAREAARHAVNLSGVVEARTVSGRSGAIELGGGEGSVWVGGRLDASGPGHQGGSISVTGREIALQGATLDASGNTGGGRIQVGGERQGGGSLQRAQSTTVDARSQLHADARSAGNGGDVVLWADGSTRFAGAISARGAGPGGRGGEAEVSGRNHLVYKGRTDLRAASGRTGNLLLDPYNVTISSAPDSGAGFAADGDDTVINTTTLQNALGLANVTVSTGSSGTQAGNITVANAVTWSSGHQLTLNAANNITVDAPISATAGGGIQLTAGNGITLASGLSVGQGGGLGVLLQANDSIVGNSGASISTQGQAITLNSDRDASGAGFIHLSSGNSVTSNGGDVTMGGGSAPLTTPASSTSSGFAGVGLSGATVSAGSGSIALRGTSSAAGGDGVAVDGGGLITTTGNISLSGAAAGGNSGVSVTNAAAVQTQSGAITVDGTGNGTSAVGTRVQSGGTVSASTTGAVTLSGTTAGTSNGLLVDGGVVSTGSGALTMNATAYTGGGDAFVLDTSGAIGSTTGSLTLNADSLRLASGTLSGGGTLSLQPITSTTTLGLGNSASGVFNLDTSELARIQNGFSTITLGKIDGSGAIDLRSVAFNDPVTIRTPSGTGSITLNGALSTGSGSSAGSITLQAGGALTGAAGSSITTQNQAISLTGAPVSGAMALASNGGLLSINQTGSGTVSGLISGSGGLTKAGTGVLTLSNSNTYSGATSISSGTLRAGSTSAFGSNSALTVTGTLDLGGFSNSVGSLAGAGTVRNGNATAATLTTGADGTSTGFSGLIQNGTGALALTKTGSGTLTLSGANTYTGGTTVNAGTLRAGVADAFAINKKMAVASGATLDLGGFDQLVYQLNGGGIVTNNGAAAQLSMGVPGVNGSGGSFSGSIQDGTGPLSLALNGAALTLSGTNTFTGGLGLNYFSTLTIGGAGSLGAGTYAGAIALFNGTLKFSSSTDQVLSGAITSRNTNYEGDAIIKDTSATSTLTINSAWTYTVLPNGVGNLVVNAGTLRAGSTSALGGAKTTLTVGAGGTLDLAGYSNVVGSVAGAGTITSSTAGAVTLSTGALNTSTSFSGTLQNGAGTLSLTKAGTGTLSLAGHNTYTGETTISAGKLAAGATNGLSAGSTVSVGSGATLDLAGFGSAVGALAGAGTVTNSGGTAATLTAGGNLASTVFSGVMQNGAGGLNFTKDGTGTLTLTNANTHTGGTTVDAGTLQVGQGGTTGTLGTGAVTTTNGSLAFNRSDTYTFSNAISGSGAVVQSGPGTTILANTNTYTGGTTVNSGTLQVGNASGTRLGAGLVVVDAGARLLFNTTGYHGGTLLASNLSGAGTVEVAGSASDSIVRLSGDNSAFSGTLQVNANARATLQSATAGSAAAAFVVNGVLAPQVSNAELFLGSLSGSGSLSLGGGASNTTLTVGGNGMSSTFDGRIGNVSDSISLRKVGAGTLTLAGTNTYTGATLVDAGTLHLTGSWDRTGAASAASVAAGATLSGSGTLSADTLTLSGAGTVSLTGSNAIGRLAVSGTIGALTLHDTVGLNVDGIDSTGPVHLSASGTTSDITLSQPIRSAANGDAVVLSAGRNFINDVGAGAITTGAGGRFLVYSTDWAADTVGGLGAGRLYNRTPEANMPASITQGGSQLIYRRQPVLTVAVQDTSRAYGDDDPALSVSVTGLVNGDSAAAAYSGSAWLSSAATVTSAVGSYAISAAAGTLASGLGYGFAYTPGTLRVTPRTLTVTSSALSRAYGDLNPALTYTVGGAGLVNGDSLSGALSTAATAGSNVGRYAVTEGTLVASPNYALSFVGSELSVTPRVITVLADAQSRVYGDANPSLAYHVGGAGLVNGDALFGALSAQASARSHVGQYQIQQGSLSASANYTLQFQGNWLNVTPRTLIVSAAPMQKIQGTSLDSSQIQAVVSGLADFDRITAIDWESPGAGATSAAGRFALHATRVAGISGSDYTLLTPATVLEVQPSLPPSTASPALAVGACDARTAARQQRTGACTAAMAMR